MLVIGAAAAALTVSLVSVAAEPTSASHPAVEPDQQVYVDQAGFGISGGRAVASADAERIAVTTSAGAPPLPVRVYDWDGLRWSPVGDPIGGGVARAMSGDGQRLAVGDWRGTGRIRVLEWNGTVWSQVGGDLVGQAEGERFGWSVEMSFDGNRVAIGAPGDVDSPSAAGSVRVFEWVGSDWSQVGDDFVGDAGSTNVGWSLALSVDGDRVAISELPTWDYGADNPDEVFGAVRVIEWDGFDWTQVGGDIAAVGSVAFSESADRLAVGFRGGGDPAIRGRVWVFDLDIDVWDLVDYSEGSPAQSVSLSADGRRLAYSGNRLNQPVDADPGTTYIRQELVGGGWAQLGVIRGEFFYSGDFRAALSADGDRIVTGNLDDTRVFDISSTPFPPLAAPVSLQPARLYDSRSGAATVDGVMAGRGRRAAGSVTEIPVAGRGGVPTDVGGVMLSVVAVNTSGDGHLTVFPCGDEVPLASNLNYVGGQVIANSVLTGLSATGTVCVFTFAGTDLVVDVTGYTPLARATLRPVEPHRLVDSRENASIGDGFVFPGGGIVITSYETWTEVDRLPAGSVTEFSVGGWPRRPVPLAATGIVLDVVAVDPAADGYLTIYACDTDLPLASSVNYAAGRTIANLVVADIEPVYGQRLCLYTSATLDVVVDVTGYSLDDSLSTFVPGRLLDSRPGESTVDAVSAGIGRRAAGSITEIQVAGRGGVRADASSAILNVVAVNPSAAGHLTVFPCGTALPLASNLNYATGQVIANSAFTKLGPDGTACIHTYAATDLVVDVTGAA